MLERFTARVRDTVAERTLTAHTKIAASQGVKSCYQTLIADGGVPIGYANHESHADGIALAAISKYLINLALQAQGSYSLKGFVILFAASMASGDQSEELKNSYDLLKGGAKRLGMEGVTITRGKDKVVFGMKKPSMELRPLMEKLRDNYGIFLLPESTVQGGRHPQGADIEEIYGMQEVQNNSLTEYFELMKRVLGRQGRTPFFMPIGLHGSFRIIQSMEGDPPKPKLTPKGKASLSLGGLTGLSLLKIQANLLMPFTEEEIVQDLGSGWMNDGPGFNTYAMEKIIPGIPPVARGIYNRLFSSVGA